MAMSWRFITCAALFITCLLTANVIAAKLVVIGGVVLPAGIVIFPVSYIVADVLTEVWGYGAARRVIWLGFACNALMVLAIWIGGELPAAAFWKGQGAYTEILGQTPRIVLASFLAYLAGEFANAYVMAKVKILTAGRWLWIRTIGSTIVGEGLDSAVFITLAFGGGLPLGTLGGLIAAQWWVKVAYEAVATPLTYAAVGWLKSSERVDTFDYRTDFNPIRM
ncbi:MAG: transporter [Candidatus Rokubacteria bacterium 13_1_40CM_69_27]|nr:MAG: transporter [Candidatus Rokubacteria bacterium 13_1_40CM_69_27]OLC30924.1 MAG: transporter [Candidatus Rokubacteria bacterium 13_1_40CM_4_69_5]